MPIVTVRWVEGRTKAQKAEVAEAITEIMVRIAKGTREATQVIFEDIRRDDWADGGVLKSDQ